MANELVKTQEYDVLAELANTENMVKALLSSKHYAKIGQDGIYAIVQKAKSLGVNPMEALNGALYYVQGKVEMTAQMMNRLIRMKGHSIQKDEKSTKTNCILHGKRADNGDVWSVSFGLDDAKKAGLVKPHGPWEKYTESMCFARALSMLARQLFPDVIFDCYVTGEVSDAPALYAPIVVSCTPEEALELADMIHDCEDPSYIEANIFRKLGIRSLNDIPADKYRDVKRWVQDKLDEKIAKAEIVVQEVQSIEMPMEMSVFDDSEAP